MKHVMCKRNVLLNNNYDLSELVFRLHTGSQQLIWLRRARWRWRAQTGRSGEKKKMRMEQDIQEEKRALLLSTSRAGAARSVRRATQTKRVTSPTWPNSIKRSVASLKFRPIQASQCDGVIVCDVIQLTRECAQLSGQGDLPTCCVLNVVIFRSWSGSRAPCVKVPSLPHQVWDATSGSNTKASRGLCTASEYKTPRLCIIRIKQLMEFKYTVIV